MYLHKAANPVLENTHKNSWRCHSKHHTYDGTFAETDVQNNGKGTVKYWERAGGEAARRLILGCSPLGPGSYKASTTIIATSDIYPGLCSVSAHMTDTTSWMAGTSLSSVPRSMHLALIKKPIDTCMCTLEAPPLGGYAAKKK